MDVPFRAALTTIVANNKFGNFAQHIGSYMHKFYVKKIPNFKEKMPVL